jgi:hypothetical protein
MLTLSKSGGLGIALLAGAAISANAQQSSLGYDGAYAGSMVLSADPLPNGESYPACVNSRPVSMQIAHGVVTVSYVDWGRNTIHYRGKVGAAGDIQAWHTNGNGTRSILTGSIQQATFTGDLDRDQHRCPYSVVMSVGAGAGVPPR